MFFNYKILIKFVFFRPLSKKNTIRLTYAISQVINLVKLTNPG